MLALTINCGSSTLKCTLIDAVTGERVRVAQAELHAASDETALAEGRDALARVLRDILGATGRAPRLVAHRIVHGGDLFRVPVRIDDATAARLATLGHLAPLHNRLALAVLAQARTSLPELPHVAVFDTSFHATLPAVAQTYALPPSFCESHGIRRFGFHGLSHANVLRATAETLRRDAQSLRIVSCHLGNGASLTAIQGGASVETSMGMTPLEGLVMGTRAGDLDPGVLLELLRVPGMNADGLGELLYRGAGLQGLTGTHDMRQIERRAAAGEEACQLALSLYAHRVRKYIGAYAAVMGGLDVIAFTGGVGEHSAMVRQRCLEGLEFLGVVVDQARNRELRLTPEQPAVDTATPGSHVRVVVVVADEEREMAREAAQLLGSA